MLKNGFRLRVPVHGLLMLGSLVLLPALARADDFSWGGDSSCTDPPIFSDIFTLPATNATGGLCRAFGNHTGAPLTSLIFTTPYAGTDHVDSMFCDPGPFLSCDYRVDGTLVSSVPPPTGTTLTVEFFGNVDHSIAVDTVTDPADPLYYNFFINLNNLDANGRPVFGTGSPGGWGANNVLTGAANGATVPEPQSGALLLTVLCAMVARLWMAKKRQA